MSKSFDQIVKGSITIKKQCKKKNYIITFRTNNQFLRYQVWSADNAVNSSRSVYKQSANNWVNQFNNLNASLKASNKPLFSPTTIMEIGNDKYVFVIHKAKINDNGNMVFSVSTNEINLLGGTSKKMIKLLCGRYDGVRFDIDSAPSLSYGTTLGGTNGSSWSFCFTYEQNTNPPTTPIFLGPQGSGGTCWSYWGYSSSPWYINGTVGDTDTPGFLFMYNNFDDCGSAIGADNGPSQLFIASSAGQINALNDPSQSIGGSLSQAILTYSPSGYNSLLPGLTYDDDPAIYYVVQPQSATISSSIGTSPTFSLSSLPPISIGDIQYGQLNIQTQLSNNLTCNNTQGLYANPIYINPTIINCQPDGAASLEYGGFLGIPTGNINLSDQCTFTLTLTQQFYQNYNNGNSYAYSATPFSFSITIDQ